MSAHKKPTKAKPKYALLVYAMLPEQIDYFLLPLEAIGKGGRQALRRAHGNYIGAQNQSDKFSTEEIDHGLCYINEALCDPEASWIDDKHKGEQAKQLKMAVEEFDAILGSWAQYKLDVEKPRALPRIRLVQCGVIM